MILYIFTCLVSLTVVLARTEHYLGPHRHVVTGEEAREEVVLRNRRSTQEDGGDGEVLLGLTQEQHNLSLDLHLYYRRMIPASNMQKMRFNLPLAEMAYNLTESCYMRHWWPPTWPDQPYNSGWIGQNLYATTSRKLNITFGITGWYDEKVWYNYDTNSCHGPQCGHYTQLVWGDSALLGCAYSFCPEFIIPDGTKATNFHFYACNYGPSGNFNGVKPYKLGPACSECSDTRAFWCDTTEPRGLCEPKPNGTTSSDVVCVGSSFCQNGGAIGCDCTCTCATGFRGRFCTESCVNESPLCGGGYPLSYCTHPVYKTTMHSICPITCGLCGTASPERCDFPTGHSDTNTVGSATSDVTDDVGLTSQHVETSCTDSDVTNNVALTSYVTGDSGVTSQHVESFPTSAATRPITVLRDTSTIQSHSSAPHCMMMLWMLPLISIFTLFL